MTKPFDLIYFEYELLHPKLSIITIMRAAPKSVICVLILYIISFVVYMVSIIYNLACEKISGIFFATFGVILCLLVKKFKIKHQELNCYLKKAIAPLRKILQKTRLYNSAAVDFLIEKCEEEKKRETLFETYLRRSKTLFTYIRKCILFIIATIFFMKISLEKDIIFKPTADGIASSIMQISYIDSSLAVSVAFIFICTAIFASVLEYAVYTVFRELIDKRRNRICDLIDDLKFIRIDFGYNRQNKS